MTNRQRRRRNAGRHWRNFLTGILLGAAIQTPVFAATEFIPSDWTARLMHGDPTALLAVGAIVVVLAIVVAWGFRSHGASKPRPPDPENSIGRHRHFHG